MDTHTQYPPSACPPGLEPEIERELLRAYIDSANDGIFVVCDEMKFHVANPLMATWLGVSETELTAHGRRMPITELFGLAETGALFREHFRTVLEGRATRFEMEINPPRGEPRWVEISMNRVRLNSGELVIGILRDVTERRLLQTTLQHHTSHDDLTGLVNRREFQQRLHALVGNAKTRRGSHVLVYIDLDQFKLVNDSCGHLARGQRNRADRAWAAHADYRAIRPDRGRRPVPRAFPQRARGAGNALRNGDRSAARRAALG